MRMVRGFVAAAGVILMALGLAGLFDGGYTEELGVFGVSAGQNVIHIIAGGFALMAALSGTRGSTIYCLVFGIAFGILAVIGFTHFHRVVDPLNLNPADDLLHLAIAGGCLWVGGSSEAT
jgi:Domain of unknown function (DUF4383)